MRNWADRLPLVSIFAGNRQVCQIAVTGNVTQEIAAKILVGIAKKFAAGVLEKSQLFRARDQQLKAMGLDTRKAKKKPAAANKKPD